MLDKHSNESLSHLLTNVHNLNLAKAKYDRAGSDADRSEIASIWFRDDADELLTLLKEVIDDGKT